MKPVLFQLPTPFGTFPISSFGVFLLLAFILVPIFVFYSPGKNQEGEEKKEKKEQKKGKKQPAGKAAGPLKLPADVDYPELD